MNKQLTLNLDDKNNKKLEYYKNACKSIDCRKIDSLNTVDDISGCMVNCLSNIIKDRKPQTDNILKIAWFFT